MNRKMNFYIMCAIVFLQGLVFYGPVATVYRQSRGLSMYEIFLIESILTVLMLIFEVPWGYFADRFGYKLTLVMSNIIFLISKIVFYEAHSFYMFLLEATLIAIAIAGISGCDAALIYSSVDEDKAEKAFGIYTACSSAGFFFASGLSTFLIAKSLDYTAFFTIIPYGIAVILTCFLKDTNHHKSEEKVSMKSSLKLLAYNKRILIFVFGMALVSEVTHSVCVFLNQPQYLRSGITLKYFGFLTALMQVICLLSARSYRITKRFGQNRTIKGLFFIIFISCAILAFTRNPIISVGLIVIVEGSFALSQPISLDIQNKSITTQNRATMLSLYAMFSDFTACFISLATGKAADISLSTAFIFCSMVAGIAFIFLVVYFKKNVVEIA